MTETETERAADEVVALLTKLGASREDAATICFAVAINHMKVTTITLKRARLALELLWRHRHGKITEGILVPAKKE